MDKLPYQWEELSKEENEKTKKHFPCHELIRMTPSKVVMPKSFLQLAPRIHNLEVRDDDVWIITYPKCGTTWMQEMVWQIVNNIDFEKGKIPIYGRSPFLELGALLQNEARPEVKSHGMKQQVK